MNKLLLFTFFIASDFACAQGFQTNLTTFLTGYNLSLEVTEDNGHIMFCGGQYNALLVAKFDFQGNISWVKRYDEAGMDKATALGKNHYLVYGNYTTNYWPYQITSAIHVIDSAGVLLYNYLLPESLIINQVHPTMDGGTIAIANPNGNKPTEIFKTDSTGMLVWVKSIDSIVSNNYNIYASDLIDAGIGGLIGIINYQYPDTNGSAWYNLIFRLDSSGDTIWTKSFQLFDWNVKMIKGPSNNYLLYGSNRLVLLDSSGNIKWCKFGANLVDCKLSPDSNFVFSVDYSHPGILKLDTNGTVMWLQSYTDVDDSYMIPLAVEKDSGFAVISLDNNHQYCTLVKTDSLGASGCDSSFTIPVFRDTMIYATPTYHGIHPYNLQIADTSGWTGIAQLPSFTKNNNCIILNNEEIISDDYKINIYPNPATSEFKIECPGLSYRARIEIFNMLGEKIYSVAYKSKSQTINNKLSPGIYFVRLSDSKKQLTRKLVLE